jgi:hypothetical protein
MLVYHLVEEEAPWSGENNGFIFRQVTAGNLPPFESDNWKSQAQLERFVRVSVWQLLIALDADGLS